VDRQVFAQGAVEGVAGGSSGHAAREQPARSVGVGVGQHRGAGAVLALGVEQSGDRVRQQQSVLGQPTAP
jgi:hypothetical protein